MNNWENFYKNRINSSYQSYFEKKYAPFLKEIIKSTHNNFIAEGGCGIGSVSKYLVKEGIICVGFDNKPEMVKLANENVPQAFFFKDDLLNPTLVTEELIVTHGVLEHMNNDTIKTILQKFPNSIHFVPTNKYTKPSFGDERLLKPKYWENTFNIKEVKTFNNEYDLMFKSNY